jgi:hypothetical protein
VSSQPTMGISEGRCTRSTLSMLFFFFVFSSFFCTQQSSQLCNPIKANRERRQKRQVRKLPRDDHTCGRGRNRGGSAIYFTQIPASLAGTLIEPQKTTKFYENSLGSCSKREGFQVSEREREGEIARFRAVIEVDQLGVKGLKILERWRERGTSGFRYWDRKN